MAENDEQMRARLVELQLEHRALDKAIVDMSEQQSRDDLQIRRLKKRKLELKDIIERLRSKLIPDLLA